MKTIVWILMVVMALITTKAEASDSRKTDDSDSRCGNRASFVRGDRLTILALTADQRLLRFRECHPMRARDIGIVYGLQAPDTMLVGIDFRVQDGQLYGVGNGGGIYTINTTTAMATLISSLTVSLAGDSSASTSIPPPTLYGSSATPARTSGSRSPVRWRARPRPTPPSTTRDRPR